METISTYGIHRSGSASSSVCGPDLCKFYSRPLDVKSNLGETDIEYESENDEPISSSKKLSKINCVSIATQTDFRESEVQTDPWDPPFVVRKILKEPEVLQLKELSYGNGLPVSQTEIDYILETRRNRDLETFTENAKNFESFRKKKEHICSQVRNEWNYKVSKQSNKLLNKLKQMEITLAQELSQKAERQEKLLNSLWTQKKEHLAKMNSKLQKELKKEIKVLEKRSKSGTCRFDAKAYGIRPVSKELAIHIKKNRECLNRDIDYLLTKYHMNPNGLSKLTDWLERKRVDLNNEIPLKKPVHKSKEEKVVEKAYQDLLDKKKINLSPPKLYSEVYKEEESVTPLVRRELEFDVIEIPEEAVNLVTVWQQVLRGRAYQKQMLELIESHRNSLEVLLSS